MAKVKSKAYESARVILLAFNWEEGKTKNNFIGFAIKRSPGIFKKGHYGFYREKESWLENRLTFHGPAGKGDYRGSDKNPIQKFMWWDGQVNDEDQGKTFSYTILPALYEHDAVQLLHSAASTIKVKIPSHKTKDGKISSYFNRAVVSSQSFSLRFLKDGKLIESKRKDAYYWLSNGLYDVFKEVAKGASSMEGAVYHLEDKEWVIKEFSKFGKKFSMVLDYHVFTKDSKDGKHKKGDVKDDTNEPAKIALKGKVDFKDRTKTNIMHDKFLVHLKNNKARKVMMGSANFTTSALTSQANLLHLFDSHKLADLYLKRKKLIEGDPSKADTTAKAGWSPEINIGKAKVRVFFSPEKDKGRLALQPVVDAVKAAKSSVIFCIFTPTDAEIRNEIFKQASKGKMMFGLVNSIGKSAPKIPKGGNTQRSDYQAKIELYSRSKNNKDVFSHRAFDLKNTPFGFASEISSIKVKPDDDGVGGGKGSGAVPEVYIHHKFIVIDAETDNPVIYTGSANFSGNSAYHNDENMLEIKNAPEVARVYLGEFMRLYEHYRSRTRYQQYLTAKNNPKKATAKEKKVQRTFKLVTDSAWAKDDFKKGTPAFNARINMVK